VPHLTGEKIEATVVGSGSLLWANKLGGSYTLIEASNDPFAGVGFRVHKRED